MFSFASRRAAFFCASISSLAILPYRQSSASAASRQPTGVDTELQDEYSDAIALAEHYVETERLIQGVPGVTIAVLKNNRLIWSQGFGYIDIESRTLADPYSLMRIASISKSLTSAGIGLLLQRNQLRLSDNVQDHITNYPLLPYKLEGKNTKNESEKEEMEQENSLSEELCSITVEQLCNHQSGIRGYKDDEFLSNTHYMNSLDTLAIFQNDALEFKPGTKYAYSTYNYCVLAAIMEQITAQKYIHFMQHEVLDKLNMFHTFYEDNAHILPVKRSKQYVRVKDKTDLDIEDKEARKRHKHLIVHSRARERLYHAAFVDNSNKFAGGGYLSTCIDLARFGHEMVFGDFLSDDVKQQLFLDVRHKEYAYGVGWEVLRNEHDEIVEISHSGGAVGGCSHLLIVPKEKLVVAILMNLETGNPYITRQVAKFFSKK